MLFHKNTCIVKNVLLIYVITVTVSVTYNIMKMSNREASNSGQLLSK